MKHRDGSCRRPANMLAEAKPVDYARGMTVPISRRAFLGQTAATSVLAATAPAAAQRRVPVVDTHLHCFAGRNDKRFPYHERAPYRPEEVATPEHLLRCMDGGGVDYAVVVHPEPYQDDHRYLEHC